MFDPASITRLPDPGLLRGPFGSLRWRASMTGVLVIAVAGASMTGCQRTRLFQPVGPGQGKGLFARSTQPGDVRVTSVSDSPEPETELEPVPQRLATANRNAEPARPKPRRDDGASRTPPTQTPTPRTPPASGREASKPPIATVSHEQTREQTREQPLEQSLDVPESMAGVDLTELMAALQDAPPAVRQQAVSQMIAMSRRQARPSHQPTSIDDALNGSLDHLPELPDEVLDQGVSPKRLASQVTSMQLSDQDASIPDSSMISRATMGTPIVEPSVVTAGGQSGPRLPAAMVEPASAATASPVEMTNGELFSTLVTRLREPQPNETEADRYRRQVMVRHLMVLSGDPDSAAEEFDGLSVDEQEYLRHQLLGLWTIVDPNGHPVASRRLTSALPQMREATKFLAAASDSLEVRSLEFCTEIEAYGQIKPFANRRFQSGQEVILYCEIDNFVDRRVDRGFETMLQGSYDVLDANDAKVASQTLPVDRQISRNHVRDYFIAYQMRLPRSLDPGSYRFRLTMEDVHGRKFGQSEVEFDILP